MSTEENNSSNDEGLEAHLSVAAKQSGIYFIGRSFGYLFGFVTNFLLAKYFGAEIYGQYSLILSTVAIPSIFTISGLNLGILKYVSRYRSKGKKSKILSVIKIAFFYSSILAFSGALIIIFLRKVIAIHVFSEPGLKNLIIFGGIILIPLTFNKLLSSLYRAYKDLKYIVIGNFIIRRVLFVSLLVILLLLNLKKSVFVFSAALVGNIVVFLYFVVETKNFGINLYKAITKSTENAKLEDTKRELLKYSSTAILIQLAISLLNHTDKIMIGVFKPSAEVGIYNLAAKVALLARFFLMSTNKIFSTLISELYSTGKLDTLQKLYSMITKWIIILTLPLITTMVIFSKTIVEFFGKEYLAASSVLVVLALCRLVNAAVGANGMILNMSGHEKLLLVNNISLVVVNIILNVILIPKIGVLGAAIATGISIASINILKLIEVKRLLDIFPYTRKYFIVFLNLMVITIIGIFFKNAWNTVISVFVVTLLNILISVGISYYFKDEIDKLVFSKVKKKLRAVFS